ncbi:hypothetical protein NDU88_004263 [Pleurodeles waltl]|uniref:Uncharacterized protein n=1 Tax=Pleurodeles waltl TaxID=8319 RepID=A0AAV7T805_PLEWA|nr:hypothetical protein NDU88_004263 [Pleurodeles waltl]
MRRRGVLSDTPGKSVSSNTEIDEFDSDEIRLELPADNYGNYYDEYVFHIKQDEDFQEKFVDIENSGKLELLKNQLGEEMFSPYELRHPHSGELWPIKHVSMFMKE